MNDFKVINKALVPSLPDSLLDSIPIPTNQTHESFYIYSLHKSASTMLQRAFMSIGAFNGLVNVNLDGWRFQNDHTYTESEIKELARLFQPTGYWYGVMRQYYLERAMISPFDNTKKSILLIRDPRDILTSYFFSLNYSHNAPGTQGKKMFEVRSRDNDIDTFVLSLAQSFRARFDKYIEILIPAGNVKTFRYEDVVLDKLQLFVPALAFLDLEFPKRNLLELVRNETQIPAKENAALHIRKVLPGDYKDKLKAETIGQLNEIFAEALDFFDYQK